MDANNQPDLPNPSPQPAPTPPPAAPATPVNSAPAQAPAGASAAPGNQPLQPSKSKSRVPLFAGIGAAVAVLLIAVIFVAFVLPGIQARAAATAYMDAATKGDANKLTELTGDDSADGKAFQQNVADSMHGSYKADKSKGQDGKYYMLYTLTDAKVKYARLIVEKQDGKWEVTSVVYANSPLALIPSKSSASQTAAASDLPASATSTQSASTASACLAQDDYKWMNFDKQPSSVTFDTTYDPSGSTFNKTDDMFFKPDTTNEDSLPAVYDDWADFAKHNADKQWKFRLEGSTYGPDAGTAASKQLANDRANKVKTQLVSRGVPADRIVIDTPHNYSQEAQDDSMNQIYRRVQVVIDPTCTGSSASTTGR